MSNVHDFGAMGDGVHDDTDAILHALKDGGGVLEFPRGDYRITRPIVIELKDTGRISIHGTGGVAKLLMHGPGPVFDLRGTHAASAAPSGFKPGVWQHERMPTISNIEIEGKHPEADGVKIVGVMQPTLTGVLIREVRNAVHITGRARNVLISHCHLFHNTGINVWLDRVNLHQTIITGSHISYGRLGGIRIENSEIRNLQITGNDIEYNNSRSHNVPDADDLPTAEIYIECGETGTVREVTISSNTIQATYSKNGANIRMIGSPTPDRQKAGMLTISANVIGSQETNVHLTSCRGITLEGNYIYSGHHRNLLLEHCKSILIGANCFGHNPDYHENELCTGIRLEDCENCTMTGLQIQDAQAGEHTVKDVVPIKREGLIELIRCQRLNLTGIQVLEGTPYGLYVEDTSDTVITGSSILDTRAEPKTAAAIKWVGSGSHNLIANCRINRPIDAPAHVKMADNVVT
ncbi:MAG TPA: right-handed parallel beta-helix repeat-containing protein [Planctomycetaceae bacterium]|nr:right-handed parallel beta-helix repeat-containing protein [Planctomycetaceae bacterium]